MSPMPGTEHGPPAVRSGVTFAIVTARTVPPAGAVPSTETGPAAGRVLSGPTLAWPGRAAAVAAAPRCGACVPARSPAGLANRGTARTVASTARAMAVLRGRRNLRIWGAPE